VWINLLCCCWTQLEAQLCGIFVETGSCIVAQAGLKLANFLLSLPNAGITGMNEHAQVPRLIYR
jgi:hypothetical protein